MSTPLVITGLFVFGALYMRGAWRQRGPRRSARSLPRWRLASFLGGTVTVAVALLPPIDHLAERSLTAHMVQHLLLVAVAAPLMAAGRWMAVAAMAGGPVRAMVRRIAPLVRWLLALPVAVWVVHTTVLWMWHVPRLYVAALADPVLHALEHITLLGAAVLFWLVVADDGLHSRLGSVPAASYLFAAAMQCGILGALLTLSSTPWYPGASAANDPLGDQQLAGVLMWIPATLVYLVATLAVLARPLSRPNRPAG
jgi:putative membrane protein